MFVIDCHMMNLLILRVVSSSIDVNVVLHGFHCCRIMKELLQCGVASFSVAWCHTVVMVCYIMNEQRLRGVSTAVAWCGNIHVW